MAIISNLDIKNYILFVYKVRNQQLLSKNVFLNTTLNFTAKRYHELSYYNPSYEKTEQIAEELIFIIKNLMPNSPDFFENQAGWCVDDSLVYKSVTIGKTLLTYIDQQILYDILIPSIVNNLHRNVKIYFNIHEDCIGYAEDFLRYLIPQKEVNNIFFLENAKQQALYNCI